MYIEEIDITGVILFCLNRTFVIVAHALKRTSSVRQASQVNVTDVFAVMVLKEKTATKVRLIRLNLLFFMSVCVSTLFVLQSGHIIACVSGVRSGGEEEIRPRDHRQNLPRLMKLISKRSQLKVEVKTSWKSFYGGPKLP